MHYEKEIMNRYFTKHKLYFNPFDDGCKSPKHILLHNFTDYDINEDPHDHPWGFTSHVLFGSYKERIYLIKGVNDFLAKYHKVEFTGKWSYVDIVRYQGTVHTVGAGHIHQIIDLPDGECWTAVVPNKAFERKSGFYRFGNIVSGGYDEDNIQHRYWDENEFTTIDFSNFKPML